MKSKINALTIISLLTLSSFSYGDYVFKFNNSQSKGMIPEVATQTVFSSCKDILDNGNNAGSGIYSINPVGASETFDVYCDMTTSGGGWTVFHSRMNGSVDFYRGWNEYKAGFGDVSGEHWLGNDKLNLLTKDTSKELMVQLWHDGNYYYASYSTFSVLDEANKYKMSVNGYSGTAGDNLARHNGQKFTTKDQDNDVHSGGNCAVTYTGAWWYEVCHNSNLNGTYGIDDYSGNVWWGNSGPLYLNSIDKSIMMVR